MTCVWYSGSCTCSEPNLERVLWEVVQGESVFVQKLLDAALCHHRLELCKSANSCFGDFFEHAFNMRQIGFRTTENEIICLIQLY